MAILVLEVNIINTNTLDMDASSEKALELKLTCESYHKTAFNSFDCMIQETIFALCIG